MTFPFKVTNPEDIPPGKSWTITEDELKQITEQNEALIGIRGRVITSALLIEQKLDFILASIFFGDDIGACSLFRELILEKEFFTFFNKWKLFREITKRKIIAFEKEETRKQFCELIHLVIETRDQFAHGDIAFSGTRPRLEFLEDGKRKFIALDNSYFDGLNKNFSIIAALLDELYKFLKEQRQSPSSGSLADEE